MYHCKRRYGRESIYGWIPFEGLQKRVYYRSCPQDAEWVYPPGVGQGPLSQPQLGCAFFTVATAKDWKLDRLKIHKEVTVEELRQDITITSKDTKPMAIKELTVPANDSIYNLTDLGIFFYYL